VAWVLARPATPDAFYTPPVPPSGAPGHLLREEPFFRGIPADARARRILYKTTDAQGAPAVASALGARLHENSPNGPLPQPVLPHVQDDWVRRRCAAGQVIDYRRYAGLDHLSLVAPRSAPSADLIAWTADRLEGHAAPTGCLTTQR
jgi:hypothetical protein